MDLKEELKTYVGNNEEIINDFIALCDYAFARNFKNCTKEEIGEIEEVDDFAYFTHAVMDFCDCLEQYADECDSHYNAFYHVIDTLFDCGYHIKRVKINEMVYLYMCDKYNITPIL